MTIATAIAALALAAPPGWTDTQWNGIERTLAQVQQLLDNGNKATKPRPTKLNLGGNVGKSANCARISGFYLSPDLAAQLGADPGVYTVTTTDPTTGQTTTSASPPKLYSVLVVCGNPTSTKADKTTILDGAIYETISPPFSSDPGQDAFQVALPADTEAQAGATGFACVCRTGPSCSWTRPNGQGGFISGACPSGLTMPASQVTGTDVLRKTCIEWAGTTSMPAACIP